MALAREILAGEHVWAEHGILDPSEGTGELLPPAVPGPSTEPNLARRVRRTG